MEQEKDKDFRVTDKRSAFREETSEKPKNEASAESSQQTEEQQQKKTEKPSDRTFSPPLPEANFLTLVFSLYTHAQIFFGLVPNPISQKIEKDLQQAKYNIDLLGVLKEKTQGNLSREEEQALESILYELRMVYVNIDKL
jgi:hypothetical protein